MKKLIIFFFITCISIFSCDKLGKEKNDLSGKLIYVMFDLSDSTKKPDIRTSYSKNLALIIKKIIPGDVLIAGLITQKSISELYFCIQFEFPKFESSTDNPLYKKAEQKKFNNRIYVIKDSLMSVADSTINNLQKKILKTEIIGGLQVAERVFNSYNQAKNILCIILYSTAF